MPPDLANQFNPFSVPGYLEAVLCKIEYWHEGSIARYSISYRSTQGTEHLVEWDGKTARLAE